MVHGITKTDAMLYLKGTGAPWHINETRDRSKEFAHINLEALQAMGLVKDIIKVPYLLPDGTESKLAVCILRGGKEVGYGSPEYAIFSDDDFWQSMLQISLAINAPIETAMSLFGGAKLVGMMTMPEPIVIGDGDRRMPYIGMATSHDGSFEVSCFGTMIRIVCNNTATMAINTAKRNNDFFFSVPHTANVKDAVAGGVKATIDILKQMKRFKSIANALADYKLSQERATEIAKKAFFDLILTNYDENVERTDRQKARDASTLDTILNLWELEQIRCGAWYPIADNAMLLNEAISDFICNKPGQTRGGTAEEKAERLCWSQTVGNKAVLKSNVLDLVVRETVGEKIYQTDSATWM